MYFSLNKVIYRQKMQSFDDHRSVPDPNVCLQMARLIEI